MKADAPDQGPDLNSQGRGARRHSGYEDFRALPVSLLPTDKDSQGYYLHAPNFKFALYLKKNMEGKEPRSMCCT